MKVTEKTRARITCEKVFYRAVMRQFNKQIC